MAGHVDLEGLIAKFQKGIWRYLRALGCSRVEADDLCQETFLYVLRRPFDERSDLETAGYLRTVARNLFVSARRKANRRVTMSLDDIEEDWERLAGGDEGEALLEALRRCFQRLPDKSRQALELLYRERVRREEIARRMAMAEDGVKTLLRRSRLALKDCIEQKLGRKD